MFSLKNKLFKSAFLLLLIVGALHQIGSSFYLYWTIRFYDIPMHFLGGFFVALVVLWIWSAHKSLLILEKKTVIKISIILVLVVGVLWEFYELLIGETSFSDGYYYWVDTVIDVIMDFVGAIFALIYGFSLIKKQNQSIKAEVLKV